MLAPSVAKPVVASVDELLRRIAQTPLDATDEATAVAADVVDFEPTLSAGAFGEPSVSEPSPSVALEHAADPLTSTLRDLRRRWHPAQSNNAGLRCGTPV